ncbi:MAG: 7TM diverse intracellular signaling domain-containing protein [Hydrogenophaga sp.]
MTRFSLRALWVRCVVACWAVTLLWTGAALAQTPPDTAAANTSQIDITLQSRFWLDPTAEADIDAVVARDADFTALDQHQAFQLRGAALWMRFDLPALDPGKRWYLMLDGGAFTDSADFLQRGADQSWKRQVAGDHLPVSQWTRPDRSPVFAIDVEQLPGPVWLRLSNEPSPLSPRIYLIEGDALQNKHVWTYLFIGGYLGFGLLVMFLGWVHARLYADRAFVAYVIYVACMLGFQVAFTGTGGFFFWPDSAWWNNAAAPIFMLWLTAAGIWFVREACAVSRYHPLVDKLVLAWSALGFMYPIPYLAIGTPVMFTLLNLYGLLSVLLSFTLCIWTWRLGEKYAGWLALGFLPVHLGYPFPALRAAGLLPDSWATQYAVLIGSAIEIPLLLYILHRRAKEFSENRARMRALDSADPLTGLTIRPVLYLRMRDAVRRARRYGHQCGVFLVELANHGDIVSKDGRETGDRALVVAASRLSRVVRDVDTVCRISNTRFAVLVEGPLRPGTLKVIAQHIVAKGLEQGPTLPPDMPLRFRMVSALLPSQDMPFSEDEESDQKRFMAQLHKELDRLAEDPKKTVLHLPFAPSEPPAMPA